MRNCGVSLLLFAPCFLAVNPALADDDDDDRRPRMINGVGFLGEIMAIRTNRVPPPFGALPNPPNTSRVFVLGGGQRIIVQAGVPTANIIRMGLGATLSGTGTLRADGSIVANQIVFAPPGTPGLLIGQIRFIQTAVAPVPFGDLPNPRGTVQVLTVTTGARVIVIAGIPVKNLGRLAVGAIVSVEGTPRGDGSIIARTIRFDSAPRPAGREDRD
jgi:hypothetical protein